MAKTHTKTNMTEFIELTVTTTHEGSELVSDIMSSYTEYGVAISDVCDVLDLSRSGRAWDYVDDNIFEQDKSVLIKAFFPIDQADEIISTIERELIELKSRAVFDLGTLETVKRKIDGDEWKEQWKEHFRPIHIGKVVIVPEWIKYDKKQDEIVVLLDSNMAFGTGEHETTSMCVEYLAKYASKDDVVLDVGSGSGILGITASKLGAGQVIMTDIDECAVKASNHNALLNGISNYTVLHKNLLDDNTVKGSVICCNIMAELLIAFAPEIGNNLLSGGYIILSGILADRLEKVKTAYLEQGFTFVEQNVKGEWSALVLKGRTY